MGLKADSNIAAIVRLFDDMVRCETRLYNALHAKLRATHGISTGQFEFMRYLRDHPMARVADMAENFAIGIGATSKSIDRMEERGWVQRLANPDDRRSSLLALTALGVELIGAAERTFDAYAGELITSALAPPQIAAMGSSFAALRRTLERTGIGAPIG